jgi:hypothetical protein
MVTAGVTACIAELFATGVIRVYRLEIANFLLPLSHVGIYSLALGSVLSPVPLSLSLDSIPPSPPSLRD